MISRAGPIGGAPLPLPIPEGTAILLPARLEGRRSRSVPWPPAAGSALADARPRLMRFAYDPAVEEIDAIVASIGPDRPAVIGLLARGQLPPGQALLASRLLARPGSTLPVALLNPFVLDDLAGAGLATFGFEPEDIVALARVLSGRARPLPPAKAVDASRAG